MYNTYHKRVVKHERPTMEGRTNGNEPRKKL